MDSIISYVLPDYVSNLTEIVGIASPYLAGGVLVAFIGWSIGYAVYTAFHWLNSWSR